VFVTTHYMEEAEYCDRLGLIYRGELVAVGTPSELKQQLMEDHVLALVCSRPKEALGLVSALPGVRDAAHFGRDIHLMCADPDELIPRLRAALQENGFEVDAIELITPSLEDVFVSLIEARDRVEGAQKEVRK
jgi:ABC-2 type transport system ATP-binding protein